MIMSIIEQMVKIYNSTIGSRHPISIIYLSNKN